MKLFRRREQEQRLEEELRLHVEMQTEDNLRAGLSREEARRQALVKFGGVAAVTETYRDRLAFPVLTQTWSDFRHAARQIRRSPGFAVCAIGVLALGIGVSSGFVAAGSVILYRPLDSPEAHRLVRIALRFEGAHTRQVAGTTDGFSYPEFQTYRATTRALDGLAAMRKVLVSVRREGVNAQLFAEAVSENYFEVLGIRPRLGRLFSPSDAGLPVAVLSYRSWQRDYRGDAGVIGRAIEINRATVSIIGAAPEGYEGSDPNVRGLWLPLSSETADADATGRMRQANLSWIELIGRRAPGYSLRAVQAEAPVIASHFAALEADPEHRERRAIISVVKATRASAAAFTNPSMRAKLTLAIFWFSVMIGVVLFLCASNLAGLLLARGMARQREFAVRMSIGAGRWRLVRQLLIESVLLGSLAGIAGVIACHFSLHAIDEATGGAGLLRLDGATILVTVGITFAATLIFGLSPALAVTRVDTFPALKGGGGDNQSGSRLRSLLIGAQVATSLVLVIACALFARGAQRAAVTDPGFEPRGLYVMSPDFREQRYSNADIESFQHRLRERLRERPGFVAMSSTMVGPFHGAGIAGVIPPSGGQAVPTHFRAADPDYFAAMGVGPMSGRLVEVSDPESACVINQAFVERTWPGSGSAIGRTFVAVLDGRRLNMQVTGVVPTLKSTRMAEADQPTFYFKARGRVDAQIIVRAAADEQLLRQVVKDLDPRLTSNVIAVPRLLEVGMQPLRTRAWTVAAIAALGLAVSAIGIYGAVAFSVARRTREIGIRVAVGAASRDVLRTVLGRSLRPVTIGVGVGLAGAGALAHSLLKQLTYGLPTFDPVVFAGSTVLVAGAALLAGWIPALRALRIPPTIALRHE